MKTREEAVAIIYKQLYGPDTSNGIRFGKTPIDGRFKADKHHYGLQELRELLDFIYGPPTNISEELK
jgi:hypothetical protein